MDFVIKWGCWNVTQINIFNIQNKQIINILNNQQKCESFIYLFLFTYFTRIPARAWCRVFSFLRMPGFFCDFYFVGTRAEK